MSSSVLNALESFCCSDRAVSFREFVSSPDYCNYGCMYEWWTDEIENLPDPCQELILDGSIGSGKSTVAAYYFAYRVYLLFFGSTPQAKLGVEYNTDIYGIYFSVNLATAKSSGFSLLYSIFHDCVWFKNNAPIRDDLHTTIEFIDKHFYIKFASDFAHQLSLNVWGFILDEANFRNGVGEGTAKEYSEVTELYGQLLDRQISRFASPTGVNPTLAMLVSSASYQSSFSEKRKEAIKKDAHAKSLTGVKFKLCPERYSSEMFRVFIGVGVAEPVIIRDAEHEEQVLRSANLLGTGQESDFIMDVPVNLRSQFEYNIVRALQNHCGVSTAMSSGFMNNMAILYNSYDDKLKSWFQSDELEASTADDTELIEYLLRENMEDKDKPHSLYLDLSLQSDTGCLTCFRFDGKNPADGLNYHTRVFSLKLIPPHYPFQTNIRKVKQLILDLSTMINIVAFGSDQFQSAQLRQEIQEELGLDDIRISLDSTDAPHMHWTRALVEKRIRQADDKRLREECMEQIHDWKKHRVYKPEGGSDDVFQSNIGAFFISDTFGINFGSLADLYGVKTNEAHRYNFVGGKSVNQILRALGYGQ